MNSVSTGYIKTLQKKWNRQVFLSHLLSAVAGTVILSSILVKFIGTPPTMAVILILLLALLPLLLLKKTTEPEVVTYLNVTFPQLEESTHLLLKPVEGLNPLEKLQLHKLQSRLPAAPATPLVVVRKSKAAILLFTIAVFACIAAWLIPVTTTLDIPEIKYNATGKGLADVPAGVVSVQIDIRPPSYTGRGSRQQQDFNIVAEQGATVLWTITTPSATGKLQLVFDDGSILPLQSAGRSQTEWVGTRVVRRSGFYQVRTGDHLSELYQLQMTPDHAPAISVLSPKPNTLLPYGSPQAIQIDAVVTDDYALESALIQATTASGSGEAVKFKEQQILFPGFIRGGSRYRLQKQLDLQALGMQPGDELYLYVSVQDNYRQEKRSEVYIVRLEDTTQLMSMEGMLNPSDAKPEFFRSQRQIIIETEQLIKERDTIDVQNFNRKSADLGIDQKLLRLRYGKFLGEESDAEPADPAGHEDASGGSTTGDAGHMLDPYSHKHDNAEDATFYDARTKKQLMATLSEMWKAELQLRTLKPKDALPFEYKALRLLKELQQSTRVYVAKTGTKTTPLKPELRLTGDLAQIRQPVVQQTFRGGQDKTMPLRRALGILEQIRTGDALQRSALDVLQGAALQLGARAAAQPSTYLASLAALRRILNNRFVTADINLVGKALHKMIQQVSNIPQEFKAAPDMNLSKRYFLNLHRRHD